MKDKTMDNQQRSLLSWLAGIIDGEGWVGLCKKYRKGKEDGYSVRIQISNLDIRILKRAEEIVYKYYGIKSYWGRHIPVKRKKGTPHIWLVGFKLEPLLRDLLDLCVSKRDEIKVLLEYIEYKKPELENRYKHPGVNKFIKKKNIEKENEFYRRLKEIRESRPLRDYTQSILTDEDIVRACEKSQEVTLSRNNTTARIS